MEGFDLRLIPEFDGSSEHSVTEWLEKLELVCKLRKISDEASVIPLRLTGGAFAVYLQLAESDRKSTEKVKEALLAAFEVDQYMAYEQFISRKLRSGETPDVYLAELRRLASLFGGMSDKALACAFVAGLPEGVRQLLRAGSRLEALDLDQILARARAILKDDGTVGSSPEACLGASAKPSVELCAATTSLRCYMCGGPNHLARDCLAPHAAGAGGRGTIGRSRRRGKCYRCGATGHFASACQGNEDGEGASAPASSHGSQ